MLTTMERSVKFDPRLKHPITSMVIGPTLCGKTQFVLELIRRSSSIHLPPERIVWCFGCYQDLFRKVDGVEFVGNVPDMNILDGGKRTLLIIDDFMCITDTRVTKIITKGFIHSTLAGFTLFKISSTKTRRTEILSQYSLLGIVQYQRYRTNCASRSADFPRCHKAF